jgi:hypothetical protein
LLGRLSTFRLWSRARGGFPESQVIYVPKMSWWDDGTLGTAERSALELRRTVTDRLAMQ